ncbi:MAG TPA: CaiB/BaiF CoA-transferase family protein [Caulobacteraceae bacterium]|nr:CaiB/BaiF CoA-transferase family protein [Caulobacteraceae bacterium]
MLLEGLKVVELATWIAGPGCAMIMADWGAEVIKVESPVGDPTRAFLLDPEDITGSPIFAMENRGKRGVVLDTSSQAGREALVRLLGDADVFVTNVRPGALRRARLDYDSLKDALPRLIYATVSGYGLEGEGAHIPGFDMTAFWNRSGAAYATNPPGLEPLPCRPAFGDHVTAMATLGGVLAAVHERTRTGRGRLVEASLIRVGAYALAWDMAVRLRYGEAVTAQPREDRPSALAGYFRTADDRWFFIVVRSPACFPAILRVIGRPELAADPRFTLPIADLEVVRELRAIVEAGYGRMTLAEVGAGLTREDVAWAPLATLDEVVNDPLAHAAGCFTQTPDGRGGAFAAPATPIRFGGVEPAPPRPAPGLGQHTRQILAEAGYGPEAVEAMLAAGAAVQSEPGARASSPQL